MSLSLIKRTHYPLQTLNVYIYVIKQTTTYLFPEGQLLYISAIYQTITSSLEYNDNNKNTTVAEQFQNQIEIS